MAIPDGSDLLPRQGQVASGVHVAQNAAAVAEPATILL